MSSCLPCLFIVITALVLQFGPAGHAQQPQAPASAVAPIERGNATIRGRVTDRDSTRPLSGATVQLLSADLRRSAISRTDADGGFSFEAIAPGDYRLVVRHQVELTWMAGGYQRSAFGAGLGVLPTDRLASRGVADSMRLATSARSKPLTLGGSTECDRLTHDPSGRRGTHAPEARSDLTPATAGAMASRAGRA